MFEQKSAEWSEDDNEHAESILERLEGMCKKGATFTTTRFAVNQDIDWLKSLKQRIGG
jgi:inosine/xanthosine triphosphate pyrophosphatase family protein